MNILDFVLPQLLYSQEEANVIKKVEPIGWYSFIASRLFAANKLYIGIGSEDDKDINWFCLVSGNTINELFHVINLQIQH